MLDILGVHDKIEEQKSYQHFERFIIKIIQQVSRA